MKLCCMLFLLFLSFSCHQIKKEGVEEGNKVSNTKLSDEMNVLAYPDPPLFQLIIDSLKKLEQIDLMNPDNFKIAVDFIKENGVLREVDVSSNSTKPMIIAYYAIRLDSVVISLDEPTDYNDGFDHRIYLSNYYKNELHLGNILFSENIVKPEVNYGLPNLDPKLMKKKEARILKIYKDLISIALN